MPDERPRPDEEAAPRPLEGLTVVEFSNSVAAPFAGLILSDLGAEVLKIENPDGGDHARGWPPFFEGEAATFHTLNRGKKALAVDLADPAAAAALRRLIIERADVVIQNMRAGVIDKFGLGANALRAAKPELIYCDLHAFGASGPLAAKPGYDPLMQAFGGIMSVTGEGGDRPPVRVGASLVDLGAGMWSVIGILSSLVERARTKRGASVGASLYETALNWMCVPMAAYQASGKVSRPYGSGINEMVPYQCFLTQDGWLMIAAGNDGLFRKLCGVLRRPDWAADPRYAKNADRVAGRDELLPLVEEAIRPWALDALMAALDAVGIPNAPLQNVREVADHPQTEALGILRAPPEGGLPVIGLPLSFDGRRVPHRGPTPTLGQDSALLQPEEAVS
jgi:crotonobetainyl-CoA:carnitine CoA-transferase CaiB-like acyl-CoA transferase